MKKYLLGLAVLLMGTAMMTSCSDDNDGPDNGGTHQERYSTGAYIVNAGNMGYNIESSLTAIDYASGVATQGVFKAANNRSLGNTANDGIVYGDKMYIAVDQSNTVEVVDKKTKQSIKQIKTTELMGAAEGKEPRHIIADGGYVYFTTYGGYVAQVDTVNFALKQKYQVGNYPEGLVIGDKTLYVANSNYGAGGGNLSAINLTTGTVETKNIEGINNPTSLYFVDNQLFAIDNQYYDANWATFGENALKTVDFSKGTSTKIVEGNYAAFATIPAGYLTSGTTTKTRTNVIPASLAFYVINAPYGGEVSYKVVELSNGEYHVADFTPSEKVYSPCGIAVDPITRNLFILSYNQGEGGYADYGGNGYVMMYDFRGKKLAKFDTGVGSCSIFFDSAYKTVANH